MDPVFHDLARPGSQLQELLTFMAARKFVASRHELVRFGFSVHQIENWIKSKRLIPLFCGVYSFGRDVETRDAVLRAALLVAGPEAALTGRSACEKHGMLESGRRTPAYIEVATPGVRAKSKSGRSPATKGTWVNMVNRRLGPTDTRSVDGLKVVLPSLAMIDLSVRAPAPEVRKAFLEASRLGLFGREDVAFCHQRLTGRRGATKLRPLLELWVPSLGRTRSPFEGDVLLRILARRMPEPRINVRVFGREVDFYWEEPGYVLEVDGGAYHSDPLAKARDREKTEFLRSKGLTVKRVSRREFYLDPDAVLDEVARQIGS